MKYLNLDICRTVRGPEFIGCEPLDRATWLCLVAWVSEHETGGKIPSCANWGSRQWPQQCAVTKEEVMRSCALWKWDGEDLIVFGYSTEMEDKIKRQRDAAKKTNSGRWRQKEEAPLASPEEEVMKGKVRKGKGSDSLSDSLSDSVSDSLSDNQEFRLESEPESKEPKPFSIPAMEDVIRYGEASGLPKIECESFYHHYQANGWMVGKVKMKSWQSAVINWRKNYQSGVYGTNQSNRKQAYPTAANNPRHVGIANSDHGAKYAEAIKRKAAEESMAKQVAQTGQSPRVDSVGC